MSSVVLLVVSGSLLAAVMDDRLISGVSCGIVCECGAEGSTSKCSVLLHWVGCCCGDRRKRKSDLSMTDVASAHV